MKRSRTDSRQTELFRDTWLPPRHPFRLRINHLFRSESLLCRVIRVTDARRLC